MRLALLPALAVATSFIAWAPTANAATCVDAGRTFEVPGAASCVTFGEGGSNPTNLVAWGLDAVVPAVGPLAMAEPEGGGGFGSILLLSNDGVEISFLTTSETFDSGTRIEQSGDFEITVDPWTVLSDLYLGLRIGDRAGDGPHWAVFELAQNPALMGTWSITTDANGSPQGGFLRAIVWGNATVIPLPPAALLLLTALGGLAVLRRRKIA